MGYHSRCILFFWAENITGPLVKWLHFFLLKSVRRTWAAILQYLGILPQGVYSGVLSGSGYLYFAFGNDKRLSVFWQKPVCPAVSVVSHHSSQVMSEGKKCPEGGEWKCVWGPFFQDCFLLLNSLSVAITVPILTLNNRKQINFVGAAFEYEAYKQLTIQLHLTNPVMQHVLGCWLPDSRWVVSAWGGMISGLKNSSSQICNDYLWVT